MSQPGTAAETPDLRPAGPRPKVLYLYTEVMGYTLATIRQLIEDWGAEVHVVHWDRGKLTPYQAEAFAGLHLHARSGMSPGQIRRFAAELNPGIAVVSAWQDKGYLPAARLLKGLGIPVVAGFDDQWKGGLKQWIGSWASGLLKPYFSHAWIAGSRQFEYARRMGFPADRIIADLYSADLGLFERTEPAAPRARRFVFVGRLEPVKGIETLLAAWQGLGADRQGWELVLVGNGTAEAAVTGVPHVTRKAFQSPAAVRAEMASAGAFVLPSRHEPWGVVVHEAAAAGLPILCSSVVGAASAFVIGGYNGYTFAPGRPDVLAGVLRQFIALDDAARARMGAHSVNLSRRITPATSAANLMSLLRPAAIP